ncbi:hypothetical protein Tco_0620831 [Tanacetum coccineum]
MGEPIQHTIPLLLARLVHHEDQIYEIQDHLEEIPLERDELMEHELEVLHARDENAEQEVETLLTTLGITQDRIMNLEICMEDTETRLQASEARKIGLSAHMRALEDRFRPYGERRYREYDLAHLKLVCEFSIYTVWKSVRYGVSNGLDTAYWSFLEHRYAISSLMDTAYWLSK